MIDITQQISLGEHELEFSAIQAQGPGGQHVNKTATAIQLRFDVAHSSLPAAVKQRLLNQNDSRISKDGIIVIKAQDERSQLRNKEEAVNRLTLMIRAAATVPRKRIPTKPGRAAKAKRLDHKTRRGLTKALRKPPV